MSNWYEFKASASGEETEILLYGEIGGFGISAESFVATLKQVPADSHINLRIYSPGGSVLDGNVIFGALGRHKGGVTTHIDGLAASMASVIALAGSPVKMASNALYMIHNVTGSAYGDSEDIRKTADLLDKVQETMVSTYAKKTKMPKAEIIALMDAETWFTAKEAKKMGFVDEITNDMKMAASFDLSKFKNAPPFDTTNQTKPMIIETPEYLSLKAEHEATCEQAVTMKANLEAATGKVTELTAQLSEAQTKLQDADKAITELKASMEKTATEHAAALSDFEKKVSDAAATKLAAMGTAPVKLGTASIDPQDAKEVAKQLEAIKDPAEKIRFYRANKEAVDMAFRA